MTLVLDNNQSSYQIRAYKPGFIQINETVYTHSLIISAEKIIDHWPPQNIHELSAEHFAAIVELKPSILLIGTGETIFFPPLALYGDLYNQGIGVEIMDTAAACRTFNALTAENRNVVAGLIIK